MKKYSVVISVIILLILTSCQFGFPALLWNEDDADTRSSSITTYSDNANVPYLGAPPSPAANSSDTSFPVYSGVVITDVHFGASETRHDDEFISKFSALFDSTDTTLWPRFVVCLGDSGDTGSSGEYTSYNSFIEQIQSIGNSKWSTGTSGTNSSYSFHVYTVLGNHDLYNDGWENWKKQVYPYTSYYRFNVKGDSSTKGFAFYFLDTANGTTGSKQLSDFESSVDDDSAPKIVFTHYPVYCGGNFIFCIQDTLVRDRLITAFADNNVKQVFEGHTHIDETYDFGKFQERVTASYLYSREFCFFTVNEKTGAVSSSILSF